jgi:hypothetical protein
MQQDLDSQTDLFRRKVFERRIFRTLRMPSRPHKLNCLGSSNLLQTQLNLSYKG